MAPGSGIDSGDGGKKALRANAPLHLVPLIDLLLCCIMFLLALVAWNQLGPQDAAAGAPLAEESPSPEPAGLEIRVLDSGYLLQTANGPPLRILRVEGRYDVDALRTALRDHAKRQPKGRNVAVRPDDDVNYADVLQVMEAVASARLHNVASIDAP